MVVSDNSGGNDLMQSYARILSELCRLGLGSGTGMLHGIVRMGIQLDLYYLYSVHMGP